ncbi:hypothetical protein QTP88_018965 [Uroleucon formosanum]
MEARSLTRSAKTLVRYLGSVRQQSISETPNFKYLVFILCDHCTRLIIDLRAPVINKLCHFFCILLHSTHFGTIKSSDGTIVLGYQL